MESSTEIKTCFWIILLSCLMASRTSAQTYTYPDYSSEHQESISVEFKGKQPTIADFATAILKSEKEEVFHKDVYKEWEKYQSKKAVSDTVSFILDIRNGYMLYETHNDESGDTLTMEMCFWNCADGKHKLVCQNTKWKMKDDYGWAPYVGPSFYLYDNKERKLRIIYAEDIGALIDGNCIAVFSLPRKGKNIHVIIKSEGEQWHEVLEWNGYDFQSRQQ